MKIANSKQYVKEKKLKKQQRKLKRIRRIVEDFKIDHPELT